MPLMLSHLPHNPHHPLQFVTSKHLTFTVLQEPLLKVVFYSIYQMIYLKNCSIRLSSESATHRLPPESNAIPYVGVKEFAERVENPRDIKSGFPITRDASCPLRNNTSRHLGPGGAVVIQKGVYSSTRPSEESATHRLPWESNFRSTGVSSELADGELVMSLDVKSCWPITIPAASPFVNGNPYASIRLS
jgi:hypothetical protein